jgi:hypothetical protein
VLRFFRTGDEGDHRRKPANPAYFTSTDQGSRESAALASTISDKSFSRF